MVKIKYYLNHALYCSFVSCCLIYFICIFKFYPKPIFLEPHYLSFRISSAFQKWNELKHVLTNKRIFMSIRMKFLEACVRSRLLYSCQSWELSASEMRKLESIWYGFLRNLLTYLLRSGASPNPCHFISP